MAWVALFVGFLLGVIVMAVAIVFLALAVSVAQRLDEDAVTDAMGLRSADEVIDDMGARAH